MNYEIKYVKFKNTNWNYITIRIEKKVVVYVNLI